MPQFEDTFRGEWHWICSLLSERLPYSIHGARSEITPPIGEHGAVFYMERWFATGSETIDGVTLIAIGAGRYKQERTVTDLGHANHILVNCDREEDIPMIQEIINTVAHSAMRAREFKRDNQKITGEMAIERYYRRKARGSKTTLREIAEAYGFNESYLSQVKKKYDQAGKWGSKSKKSSDKT